MTLLLLSPTLLSVLVLCVHLFRGGATLLLLPLLLALPLLLLGKGWVARLFQMILVAGALEWIRTAVFLAGARQDAGEPWVRLVLILGAVALFSLGAALLFESRTLQRVYPRRQDW